MWPINGTPTDSMTPGHSGPESNSNERALYIPQTPGLEPHHQSQGHGFKYCYLILMILFNIDYLSSQSVNGFKYWSLSHSLLSPLW